MHFAVHTRQAAVLFQDRRGIVIDAGGATLEDGDDQCDFFPAGDLRQGVGSRSGHGLGEAEKIGVFGAAKIFGAKEFVKRDDLRAARGGHIPGARNIPWGRAAAADATFRTRKELEDLYAGEAGLSPDDDVVVYCRIGERSSHTWFVLHHLLGYPKVRNYDGSWTEWGNQVRAPIERP